ncbi:MAG TPA: hypothetical protein VHO50_13575 [Bacteroidales bacterium]|nr:hypothetical protein [Bacteroidales bacterium]
MIFGKGSYKYILILTVISLLVLQDMQCQPVPSADENIPYLVTFGKSGKTSWGDDSFFSVWFFLIPRDYNKPFYIRVFDPDCGGEHDEIQGEFNTKTLFSVYGGANVDPDKNVESRGEEKGANYKKGNLLASRVFSKEARTDNKYHSFGPFNPTDGDLNVKWNSYIFKIVCEGVEGDDGNLYRYFLSNDPNNNVPIDGANAMTYKYIFRMWNDFKSVAHIFPYIDTGVIFVKQRNFDWDNDGKVLVVSRYKQGVSVPISNEDNWIESNIPVEPAEINSSLDFQFHKRQGELVKNNNVVITTKNQFDETMPFYSSPIGGVPVYIPKTTIQKLPSKKK